MMTARHDELLQAIYEAVDELNLQLRPDLRLDKNESTAISGATTSLDSLNMVNLIMGVEECVNEKSAIPVNLLERFMESEDGPPQTLGALATFILSLQNQ